MSFRNAFCSTVLLISSLNLSAADSKRAVDLTAPSGDETVTVIVQYASKPTARQHARAIGRQGRVKQTFEHIHAATYEVTADGLLALESDPNVLSINPDREVTGNLDHVSYSVGLGPVHDYLDTRLMAKGSGIGIAIIDSGIEIPVHPNFMAWQTTTSRIVYSQSFVTGDTGTSDGYGHGTHVAGIAAGADIITSTPLQVRWFWGMAPDLSIINLKVLDFAGKGTDSAVIAAVDRAIALKATYNIRILNLSLGRPVVQSYKTDPLCQAVERAWKAGIVVVVAAGNEGRNNAVGTQGYGTIASPGNDPYVITVGAVNDKENYDRADDVMTTYSSKGPTAIDHIVKPDLVAPGNRVVSYQAPHSSLVTSYLTNRLAPIDYFSIGSTTPSPYFFKLSGTSMAAPVVAGCVGLLLTIDPTLTPDQIKARLMKTAWRGFPANTTTVDPITGVTYKTTHDMFTVGAGMIDINAAFFSTAKSAGSAASPSVTFNRTLKKTTLNLNSTGAASVVWGESAIFATNVVWGATVLSGTSVVWGDNVVWGDTTMAGSSVVWGDTSPWASTTAASTATPRAEAAAIAINGEN